MQLTPPLHTWGEHNMRGQLSAAVTRILVAARAGAPSGQLKCERALARTTTLVIVGSAPPRPSAMQMPTFPARPIKSLQRACATPTEQGMAVQEPSCLRPECV
jgi:hypothetical protein